MGYTSQVIPQDDAVKNFMWYIEGMGIGLVPLIGVFITLYLGIYHPAQLAFTLSLVTLTFYVLEIGVCVVVLLISRTRMFGYGLLTMLIASPLLAFLIGLILYGIHMRIVNG